MVNWEWRPLLLRRYRLWFNRVKKKSRKTNEFLPSLRTPAYTAISLFHVVCSFTLFAWIIAHFINHKELEDLFEIIGEINLCFDQLALFLLPLVFIVPPLLPRKQCRSCVFKVLIWILITVLVLDALSSIFYGAQAIFEVFDDDKKFYATFHIFLSQTIVAIVVCKCLQYLSFRTESLNYINQVVKDDEFFSKQGFIHGAEILVMAGFAIFSALEKTIEDHSHPRKKSEASETHQRILEVLGFNHNHTNRGINEDFKQLHEFFEGITKDRFSEDSLLKELRKWHPWFFSTFLLLIQLR